MKYSKCVGNCAFLHLLLPEKTGGDSSRGEALIGRVRDKENKKEMWVPIHKCCDLEMRETRIIVMQRLLASGIITYSMFVSQ